MKIFSLFFILLVGCCQQKGWVYRDVISDYPQFDSAQLKFLTDNQFSGIEVHLLKGEFGILGFLNVCSRQIPSTTITLQIDEYRYLYTGILMEGGQRLLLPQEATALIIQALLAGQNVSLFLDSFFSTTLCPAQFHRQYKRFLNGIDYKLAN